MFHDRVSQFDSMDVDDFGDLLADMPNDRRRELIGGRVVIMMVGARWQHNVIIQDLAGALRQRFRQQGSDCRTFSETFFVEAPSLKTTTLPDIIVRCGRLAEDATSLDDPKVLTEAVSPGSEGRDRVEEWKTYRELARLRHCVLVERDRAAIDVFDRLYDGWAVRRTIEGFAADVCLPAVNASVPLSEIYEDVLPA